jgi:DNA-binding IclR family transcriptional regulator
MQTKKDAEIVGWIGRLGAASAEHVMGRFAMSRTRAYACLSRLVASGLLEQRTLVYQQRNLLANSVSQRL